MKFHVLHSRIFFVFILFFFRPPLDRRHVNCSCPLSCCKGGMWMPGLISARPNLIYKINIFKHHQFCSTGGMWIPVCPFPVPREACSFHDTFLQWVPCSIIFMHVVFMCLYHKSLATCTVKIRMHTVISHSSISRSISAHHRFLLCMNSCWQRYV